jgi:hypothetical protein
MGKRVTEILAVLLLVAAAVFLVIFLAAKFGSNQESTGSGPGDGSAHAAQPAEKNPPEKKPDEKKPDEKKPDEKKPDEKTPDEKKPGEEKPLTSHTLTYSGRTLKFEQQAAGKWKTGSGSAERTVAIDSAGRVAMTSGGKKVASGKVKGEKIKLQDAAGAFYLTFKFTAEKTKITVKEGEDPWELKVKPDKIKVARGEKTLGKVKYYKDTGKLKVKDAEEATVAQSRDLKRLSAAPGVLLIPGLTTEKRDLIMLVLFARGR